jgi:hypothetical protein
MFPVVICACPKAFPAARKDENANAKIIRNLRIRTPPSLFVIWQLDDIASDKYLWRDRQSLNWLRTPRATDGITLRLGQRSNDKVLKSQSLNDRVRALLEARVDKESAKRRGHPD